MMNYQVFVEETKNMIVNNSEWMIEDDFETNDGLVYSYIGLDNDPSYVEEYLLAMQNCGAIISRGEDSIKVAFDKDTWVNFILYKDEETYYGDKGDVKLLELTSDIYTTLF